MINTRDVIIKFRSDLERQAWETWLPTIPHARAMFEGISFNCPGGRYTPDFNIETPEHTMIYVEVKGSWKQKGGARSKRALREAASTFAFMGKFWAILPKRKSKGKVIEWVVEDFTV